MIQCNLALYLGDAHESLLSPTLKEVNDMFLEM